MFWKSSGVEIAQPLWTIMPVVNHWLWMLFPYIHIQSGFLLLQIVTIAFCSFAMNNWESSVLSSLQPSFRQLDTTVSRCSSHLVDAESPDLSASPPISSCAAAPSQLSGLGWTHLRMSMSCLYQGAKLSAVAQHTTVRKESPFPSACWLCSGRYSLGDSSLAGTAAHWGLLSPLVSTRTPTCVLWCKAPSQHSITSHPAVVHGFAPSQVQDLTFLLAELSEVPVVPFLQLVKSLWIAVKAPAHSELPQLALSTEVPARLSPRAVVKVFDTIHASNTAESCHSALTSHTPAH